MSRRPSFSAHPGQAMTEYVLVLAAVVLLAGVLGFMVDAARRSADRTENLVRADYP